MPKVYPVEGHFLMSVPAVEHDCDDPFCVESGAFTTKKPKPPAEADKPTGPVEETGPSDSTEA